MSEKYGCGSNSCDTLSGVLCDVKHCKHHTTDGRCTANTIKVENSAAMKMSETCCSTFMPL